MKHTPTEKYYINDCVFWKIICDEEGRVAQCESGDLAQKIVYSLNNIERVERQRDDLLEAAKRALDEMYRMNDYKPPTRAMVELEVSIKNAEEKGK